MLSNLQVCFNAVMPLFLIMGLGYGVKCLGGIRVEDVPGLNKMAFRFFMPVMLFWNLYTSSIDQALQPKLLLFAVGATLVMYGLSLAIVLPTEKDHEKQGVKIQGMYRSNLAIIGLPLATVLVPGADMGPVAMLAAIIVPLFNVLAVITLTAFRGERLPAGRLIKMVATNPLILGSAVGLVFLGTGWRLPTALESAVHQVAAMTSPFMLFLLGAFFRFSGLRRYRRDLIEVCLVRLFLMPALLLTAAFLIGIRVHPEALLAQLYIAVHLIHVVVDRLNKVVVHGFRHIGGVQGCLPCGIVLPSVGKELQLLHLAVEHGRGGVPEAAQGMVQVLIGALAQAPVGAFLIANEGALAQGQPVALTVHGVWEGQVRVFKHTEHVAGGVRQVPGSGQQLFLCGGEHMLPAASSVFNVAAVPFQLRPSLVKALQRFGR